MFEKFFKEREEMLLRFGNIFIAIVFISSLVWFLLFSFQTINRAITINILPAESEFGFHLDDFERLKILFEREGAGFSVLQQETKPEETSKD